MLVPSRTAAARLVGITLLTAWACSHPSAPTPGTDGPRVALSVAPSPLPVRVLSDERTGVVPLEVRAQVTAQESAGRAGTINRLEVQLVTASGQAVARTLPVTWVLTAGAPATYPLVAGMDITPGVELVRIRLSASGVDDSGHAFTSSTADAPVTMTFPGGPGGAAGEIVVAAAGDIAICGSRGTTETARLLDAMPGPVLSLGDHVYPTGQAAYFNDCYDPAWGRHRFRTFPTPGNHDWEVDAGAPYFDYFALAAGPRGAGYYSFDLAAWHVLSLNSNVAAGPGSPQYEWARADLRAHSNRCTLAYWHHPRFSSGPNGSTAAMAPLWALLQEAGAEVVLSGHDHEYERFTPQDADGRPDPRGLRQFVVGTGGVGLYQPTGRQPNSEVLDNNTWGVLKLTLRSASYAWEFVPIAGQSFRDSGVADCR